WGYIPVQKSIPLLKDEMLLGQELKFKNKLCNLKLGTFFSALPGLGASALSGRVGNFNRTGRRSLPIYQLYSYSTSSQTAFIRKLM
ncbi:hypothetical protein V7T06_11300, partial [Segatella copri]|uniref:hypothetical protein n=1 Tax=Segatella copri TaxID=165179 RepID=UPI002FEFC72D